MIRCCHQVNLQRGFGGGEIYTVFLTRVLAALGFANVVYVHPRASHWRERLPPGTRIVPVTEAKFARLAPSIGRAWAVFHTPLSATTVAAVKSAGAHATAIAHLPWYDRDPAGLEPYDLVVAVSRHVADSLRSRRLTRVFAEPLYGIADLSGARGDPEARIVATPAYDWDLRKVRDRLSGLLYPSWWKLRPPRSFARAPGITLGIVSRLTTIKQFPQLFQILTPVLARHEAFRLEVFGSGGYASVRDLRRAVAPLGDRVRWWGHQPAVRAVYAQVDYLLTGLPEKEALGLNVIEAQACGVPVLAVDAPPFTETVAPEVTGLLYRDPRKDGGRDFERLLERLTRQRFTPDASAAAQHLATFSEQAFAARVGRLVQHVES